MAQFIDRAALWAFTAASCLLFILTLTNGNLFIALPASFFLVLFLRFLIKKLPEKCFVRRHKRITYIHSLLKKWALMDSGAAITELKSLVPDLLSEHEWQHPPLLIQRLPDEGVLTANALLEIWRAHKELKELLILATSPAESSAFSLAGELSFPSVRLIDGKQLTQRLLRVIRCVPAQAIKKERSLPFSARFARFSASARPIHAAAYLILFGMLYLFTNSFLYLAASLIFAFQLSAWIIVRICARSR